MMSAQVSAGVRAGGNHPNMSVRSTCLNEPPSLGTHWSIPAIAVTYIAGSGKLCTP